MITQTKNVHHTPMSNNDNLLIILIAIKGFPSKTVFDSFELL